MNPSYRAEVYTFDQNVRETELTMEQAAFMIRDRDAAAVLLDVVDPDELDRWWDDDAFPKVTQHQSFRGAGKSGLAIGPTQRLVGDKLVPGLIDYFAYAGKCNERLRETEFVKLCFRELDAESVRVGAWAELPLCSKREYQPNEGSSYSVPPHCDAIHFGREPENWPIKVGYDEGYDQISIFLSVEDAENSAGLVMWDYRPETRPALDVLMREFIDTGRIQALENVPSLVIKGKPGQLNILNTRVMHAVEQCVSVRKTLGSFVVWHDGKWRIFH